MKELKLAVISDIHLGSRRNKASDIIANLNKAFPDNQETSELNIIFLAGDVFDRLLDYPDEDAALANIWIYEFLMLCSKHNIILRVLEGTPSHDRMQSEAFNNVKTISKVNVDVQYIKTLSIEYIEKLDIHVLYIPDEWDISTEKTLDQAKDLMKSKGLSQVDFAILHGNFDFQIPEFLPKIPRHNSSEYLKLVKHYTFIGHNHTFSFSDRIIAQGSFDRLAHGEEEPKGHVRAVITNTDREFFFIENKSARIYKTLKCYDFTLEWTLKYIEEEVGLLPANSCVRIEAQTDHLIFSNMNLLALMYPTITWSKLPKALEQKDIPEENSEYEFVDDYTPITINKDNIVSLLMDRVISTNVDSNILSRSEQLLKELI